jgi:hypothetical protein
VSKPAREASKEPKESTAPDAISVDLGALTLGDIEDVEEAAGLSFSAIVEQLGGERLPPARVLTALVWVFRRKENPDYTLDEARHLKLSEVRISGGSGDVTEDPPSSPAGVGAQSTS